MKRNVVEQHSAKWIRQTGFNSQLMHSSCWQLWVHTTCPFLCAFSVQPCFHPSGVSTFFIINRLLDLWYSQRQTDQALISVIVGPVVNGVCSAVGVSGLVFQGNLSSVFQRMCVTATGTRMVTSIKPSSVASSIAVDPAARDTAAMTRRSSWPQRSKKDALNGLTLAATSYFLSWHRYSQNMCWYSCSVSLSTGRFLTNLKNLGWS